MRGYSGLAASRWLGLLFALFLAFTPAAFGQRDTGTILGTVYDSTGAVIPSARVTITNEETGISQSSQTRADGTYVFTPLRIGSYTVEVEFEGFQKSRRPGVSVSIQQRVVVDFNLVPGQITEVIEVESALPTLQTQEGSVGEVVEERSINNLPLNGRNYNFLARLTAGVTHPQPEGRGLEASGWFVANGTRPAQNNFMLDGIDNNSNNVDFLSGAAYVIKPPVDAIGEFKLQTNNFSAEFGRAGGAVLNATLKSGTNEFHGSAWEFLRNDNLDAANFFQNASGVEQGEFKQNQFGAAAGGPIIKNKTFIFGDYEGTRVRRAQVLTATVPTGAQAASGFTDFSDLIALQSGSRTDVLGRSFPVGTIFDPTTTRAVEGGFVREPFPNNVIPEARLNQNARSLMELFPAATTQTLTGNFFANRGLKDDTDAFDVRVDHHFSDKDYVFGRYSFSDGRRFRPSPFEGLADGGGFNDGDEEVITNGAAVSYTRTISPTLINEVRAGWTREHVTRLQPFGDDTSNIPAEFGIQGIPQIEGNGGLPFIQIGDLNRIGASEWLVSERFGSTYQLSENLTKVYGNHTFKAGWEGQLIDFPWIAPPFSRGSFLFRGFFTSIPNQLDPSAGRAQFLLDATSPQGEGGIGADLVRASNFGYVSNRKWYSGTYFQDDWKATPKLTINMGVRWDFFSQTGERFHAQANFIPDLDNPRILFPDQRPNLQSSFSPGFLNSLEADGIDLVITDEFGSGLGESENLNLAPRFGFAYQLTDKVVLRGGYGIFYGGFENRGGFPNLGFNFPFQFDFNFFRANDVTPVTFPDGNVATLERGLTSVPLDPTRVEGSGLNLRGIEFDFQTPFTQGYNFTVQWEVAPRTSWEIGYVATLGRHLETFSGTNRVRQILPPDEDPQPFVPFPSFARNSSYATTNANSSFHSLQTKLNRRFTNGLNFLVTYTWGKTLTNAGSLLNGGAVGGFRAPDLPGFGIQQDMGLASFHIEHAFNFSGTFELPWGEGRQYLSGASGLKQAVLGGWTINWITTLNSGQPQTVNCTRRTTADFGCFALVDPNEEISLGRVEQYLNPDAFFNPPVATEIGQSDFSPLGGGKTQVLGPSFSKLDFSVFKSFPVGEDKRFEFRAEFFNLTNTPAFAMPSNLNFTDRTNFGQITSTRNPRDERQIQFALKFYW